MEKMSLYTHFKRVKTGIFLIFWLTATKLIFTLREYKVLFLAGVKNPLSFSELVPTRKPPKTINTFTHSVNES